jgi:hypothetical protein
MKAKLIKTDDGYHLKGLIKDVPKGINVYNKINDKECYFGFGTHSGKLSIKNCEDIENGYDLYELAEEEYFKHESNDLLYGDSENEQLAYKAGIVDGFQKALFILGDKKFSSGQLLNAMDLVWQWMNGEDYGCKTLTEVQDKHIQSLQQTEWQVEVVMDRIPADLAPDGWDVFPKLDAEGCIILKKIE